MNRLSQTELLQLLQFSSQEEIEIRNTLRSTLNTYTTLLCSIIAGILTISSISNPTPLLQSLALIIGGVVTCCISFVGYRHYKSDYVRQIESIVSQAKLQDILGITDPSLYKLSTYWKGESLLPASFIETRTQCKTSEEFISWFIKNTDVKYIKLLFSCFFSIGIFVFFVGILFFIGFLHNFQ